MRHRNHPHYLGRPTGPRKALLRNLALAMITSPNGRIRTTQAKAKALRPMIEKLVTLGKKGTTHHRRQAFATLTKKEAVHKVFTEIAPRCANRNGGYTRIVLDGHRQGDGAWMAFIEFVDGAEAPAEPAKSES